MSETAPPEPRPAPRRRRLWELLVVVGLLWALAAWQTRGLPPTGEPMACDLVPLARSGVVAGRASAIGVGDGRPLLLYLFTTSCPVCAVASRLVPSPEPAGLRVVAVELSGAGGGELRAYARRYGWRFPVVRAQGPLRNCLRAHVVPTFLLLDGRGRVAARLVGVGGLALLPARLALVGRGG